MANVIAITGISGSGKSTSIYPLLKKSGKKVVWLNLDPTNVCAIPKSKRNDSRYSPETTPKNLLAVLKKINEDKACKYLVLDTLTSALLQNIQENVETSMDTRKAWGEHSSWFLSIIKYITKDMRKDLIVFALLHAEWVETTDEGVLRHRTVTKGGLNKQGGGLESLFGIVVACRKVPTEILIKDVEKNPLLDITKKETTLGLKHVFQVSGSTNGSEDVILCSPMVWEENEIFINADMQALADTLVEREAIEVGK